MVDVEATCWKKGVFSRKKETIEIGAVLLLIDHAESGWPEFQTFVRPLRLPRLSTFCRELTGISKSFEKTARELAPDTVAMPLHRAIADAHRTARILCRLLRPFA